MKQILFQSPLHRGMLCNRKRWAWVENNFPFQSPLHRGMLCNMEGFSASSTINAPFSPLFIGACSATDLPLDDGVRVRLAFSPLFIGACSATAPRA